MGADEFLWKGEGGNMGQRFMWSDPEKICRYSVMMQTCAVLNFSYLSEIRTQACDSCFSVCSNFLACCGDKYSGTVDKSYFGYFCVFWSTSPRLKLGQRMHLLSLYIGM